MVVGIQIAGILFGLIMFYLTFLNRKRKEFTIKEFLFWIMLWIFFILISIFPGALDIITKDVFRLQRPLDLLIILGSMFLIFAVFYTYTLVRKNQRKLEEIVRKISMKKEK